MALGGYRPGSGRSKSGYYKGIYCGSTYELCWVIYALDTGIKFTRFPHMLVGEGIKYLPDFLLEDGKTIIELKGYEFVESVDKKTKLAESLGYVVTVLRKENLTNIFSYVEKKYKTKKFHSLYDGYSPIYEYKCAECDSRILRDKQSKTTIVLCSKRCSMIYNRLIQKSMYVNLNEKAKKYYDNNKDKILARRRQLYKLKNNTAP